MQASVEDKVISDVLDVTLNAKCTDSRYFLSSLATELRQETQKEGEFLLTRDVIERVFVARLMDDPPKQGPFKYLLESHSRLRDVARSLSSRSQGDPNLLSSLNETMKELKTLLLSYVGLVFTPGIFPEAEGGTPAALQLLEAAEAMKAPEEGVVPLSRVFLEDLSLTQDVLILQDAFKPVLVELKRRALSGTLAREDHYLPLAYLQLFTSTAKLALALFGMSEMVGPGDNGRKLENESLLGALFSMSPLPDRLSPQRPDIGEEFFPDHDSQSNKDRYQAILSLRRIGVQYCDELHSLVRHLLKKDTRKEMLEWLFKVIEMNTARAQINPPRTLIASNGFFFNLCSVFLKLCEPFVDPTSNKAWPHLDPDYLLNNDDRLDFSDDTRLAASAQDLEALREEAKRRNKTDFHFICECFFMTLKALHLGSVKIISSGRQLGNEIRHITDEIEELEAAHDQEQDPIRKAQSELLLKRYKSVLAKIHREQDCIESALYDPEYLTKMNTFYRLVVAWMIRLIQIDPTTSFQIPLPDPPPAQFAALPEYFLEDMVDVLISTGRAAPQVLESVGLEDTVIFFMAMMGSPNYLKNPYLRGKLVDVLHACLPSSLKEHPLFRRRSDILAFVFEKRPVILQQLVPSLVGLYVDIEFTGRHAQFYEKFHMRAMISEVLTYVWNITEHNKAWKLVAQQEGGRGVYLQFCNMLVNDSIFLLDDSLKKLEEIKEIETLMSKEDEWNALPQEERQDRERDLRQHGSHLRSLLYQAKGYISFLRHVTKETQRTFLLPEMVERVASMLNYFLKYITGPERKKLKIKNPEQYDFDPKELLTGILEVYLHLDSADLDGSFAAAIAVDGRSYRDEMFEEALGVVERMALMAPNKIEEIRVLSQKCKDAAIRGAREEEILGDVPDAFLDPIQCTLMKDPVILPTSGQTLDRATITRHLLSDSKDPFSREPLTTDMLLPNLELKRQIQEWLEKQKSSLS